MAAILAASACSGDASGPEIAAHQLLTSTRLIRQAVGKTTVVDVQALDSLGHPIIPTGVSVMSLDTLVAGVALVPDSVVQNFPGRTLARINVLARGMGQTKVVVSASGVADTIAVTSFPSAFPGTISPVDAHPGDTLVITAPAHVTFGATASAVPSRGLFYGFVSRTATQLRYIAGGDSATLTITGVLLNDSVPMPALLSGMPVTVTQVNEPANGAPATAPSVARPATIGDSVTVYGSLSGIDLHDWYSLTAAVGDSLEIVVEWPGTPFNSPDIDAFLFQNNGSTRIALGATSAIPERVRVRLTATTGANPKLEIQMYDSFGFNFNYPYRVRIYRR
jgi:hypothetical protein